MCASVFGTYDLLCQADRTVVYQSYTQLSHFRVFFSGACQLFCKLHWQPLTTFAAFVLKVFGLQPARLHSIWLLLFEWGIFLHFCSPKITGKETTFCPPLSFFLPLSALLCYAGRDRKEILAGFLHITRIDLKIDGVRHIKEKLQSHKLKSVR